MVAQGKVDVAFNPSGGGHHALGILRTNEEFVNHIVGRIREVDGVGDTPEPRHMRQEVLEIGGVLDPGPGLCLLAGIELRIVLRRAGNDERRARLIDENGHIFLALIGPEKMPFELAGHGDLASFHNRQSQIPENLFQEFFKGDMSLENENCFYFRVKNRM
jgi:hypothetical protein